MGLYGLRHLPANNSTSGYHRNRPRRQRKNKRNNSYCISGYLDFKKAQRENISQWNDSEAQEHQALSQYRHDGATRYRQPGNAYPQHGKLPTQSLRHNKLFARTPKMGVDSRFLG